MAVVYFWATIWPLAASWVLNWSRWRGVVFILIFSWMSFFLFHILLLCLFCSTLIFPPNYDGPGWTQTDLNQPKRSWTSSDITLCNLLAAFSENLFRLFWDRGLSQMTSATKGKGERGGQISRLQDHTGSSCGRADHTTTIFLRVVLSHNHNHNIYFGGKIPEGSVQV